MTKFDDYIKTPDGQPMIYHEGRDFYYTEDETIFYEPEFDRYYYVDRELDQERIDYFKLVLMPIMDFSDYDADSNDEDDYYDSDEEPYYDPDYDIRKYIVPSDDFYFSEIVGSNYTPFSGTAEDEDDLFEDRKKERSDDDLFDWLIYSGLEDSDDIF